MVTAPLPYVDIKGHWFLCLKLSIHLVDYVSQTMDMDPDMASRDCLGTQCFHRLCVNLKLCVCKSSMCRT